MCWCAGVLVCGCDNVACVHKFSFAGMRVCWFVDVLVCWYVGLLMRGCVDVWYLCVVR